MNNFFICRYPCNNILIYIIVWSEIEQKICLYDTRNDPIDLDNSDRSKFNITKAVCGMPMW